MVSQEGKLNMIRVKRLKFTLKGSNYEDAQNTALSGECYGLLVSKQRGTSHDAPQPRAPAVAVQTKKEGWGGGVVERHPGTKRCTPP